MRARRSRSIASGPALYGAARARRRALRSPSCCSPVLAQPDARAVLVNGERRALRDRRRAGHAARSPGCRRERADLLVVLAPRRRDRGARGHRGHGRARLGPARRGRLRDLRCDRAPIAARHAERRGRRARAARARGCTPRRCCSACCARRADYSRALRARARRVRQADRAPPGARVPDHRHALRRRRRAPARCTRPPGAPTRACRSQAAAAAAFVAVRSRLSRFVGPAGVQILGGHGFMQDYPVEKCMREARALGLWLGGFDARARTPARARAQRAARRAGAIAEGEADGASRSTRHCASGCSTRRELGRTRGAPGRPRSRSARPADPRRRSVLRALHRARRRPHALAGPDDGRAPRGARERGSQHGRAPADRRGGSRTGTAASSSPTPGPGLPEMNVLALGTEEQKRALPRPVPRAGPAALGVLRDDRARRGLRRRRDPHHRAQGRRQLRPQRREVLHRQRVAAPT